MAKFYDGNILASIKPSVFHLCLSFSNAAGYGQSGEVRLASGCLWSFRTSKVSIETVPVVTLYILRFGRVQAHQCSICYIAPNIYL